jgi:hypothetical protein
MMSLNYSAAEFLKIMMTLNFEKFEDGCDLIGPFRLIRHFGWFKGNYFLNLMESYIEKKTRDGQKPGNGARRSGIWSRGMGTDTSKDSMSSAPT